MKQSAFLLPAVVFAIACGPSGRADDGSGEPACHDGESRCDGDYVEQCRPDGTWQRTFCDPLQALTCDAAGARCIGPCSSDALGQSYIGCEYFPTITANVVSMRFHFSIAVSNTSGEPATITVDWGGLAGGESFVVAPYSVVVHPLPWVEELKGCTVEPLQCQDAPPPLSAQVYKGGYHVRSTRPVTVYQFSPLEYQLADEFSYSNDASLLFPANTLGGDYVVAAWQSLGNSPGFVAITATHDQTHVTITSPIDVEAGHRTPALVAGVPAELVLDRSDVVQLFSRHGDLTGARIHADAPIQVLGGHYCTNVPDDTPYCDHLEDAMLPIDALGADYVIAAPLVPALPDGKARNIRIVAAEGDTFVDITPAQSGSTYLARAGDFIEIARSTETMHIKATHKILVAQYMAGQNAGGDMGDPAMVVAVPVEQFRDDYLFHAPTNYQLNYVEVIAPIGASVVLDGQPLTGFTPTPDGVHALLRTPLGNGVAGNHHLKASTPVGVSVYGYGQYTSYWYPGGLDLDPIILQ